jgi:hypothetical protein
LTTSIDALVAALRDAANYNAAAEAPPEAVLWCDESSEFLPLLPSLLERMPELLLHGAYDPAKRAGPAIWLRGATARAIPTLPIPDHLTPVIYLPGIARDTLKTADDCPALLLPLVWLTVGGTFFGHVNGKDWTLRGFLAAERGPLQLAVAEDPATRAALGLAALRFCSRPIDEVRARRWDADALNALLAPDVEADMLDWMDGIFTPDADGSRFAAFASIANRELKFDPRKLSRQDAAKRLAQRKGKWAAIWKRFASSTGFAGVVQLLHAEEPTDLLADRSPYPRVNASEEKNLREALLKLASLPRSEASARLTQLENSHAWRRESLWARRGDAPLAQAVAHLAKVAAAQSLPPHDADSFAQAYVSAGAETDWAAMCALAAAPRELDRVAVSAALRAAYLPWLDENASTLQDLLRAGKVRLAEPALPDPEPATIVFIDGLRMDLAKELVRLLAAEDITAKLTWCWSGFPTVTATCKPLVSPVGPLLSGGAAAGDMLPLTPEGKPAAKAALYKLMNSQGWGTSDDGTGGRLWTETGRFDDEGHARGAKLAESLVPALRDVLDTVSGLARSGRHLRIVTDHGWLLMPGGLPVAALDAGLAEPQGKRARCALVKSSATTSYLHVPWSWNGDVRIATATGARAFLASQEYAHGGISPQECILPVIKVWATTATALVTITQLRWEGLRLRIEATGAADHRVDVRLGTETSGPSLIKGTRVLDEHGKTSVLISDEYERKPACLVVLNDHDRVLAHRALIVGGE